MRAGAVGGIPGLRRRPDASRESRFSGTQTWVPWREQRHSPQATKQTHKQHSAALSLHTPSGPTPYPLLSGLWPDSRTSQGVWICGQSPELQILALTQPLKSGLAKASQKSSCLERWERINLPSVTGTSWSLQINTQFASVILQIYTGLTPGSIILKIFKY